MKVNNKTLTSALFALCALMFTVAVSGGCGGGGSGNPGANTAVEGFTNEYVSPDLLSAPDEFSSDDIFVSGDANANDEYGNGNYNTFDLLSKTTWHIASMSLVNEAGDTIRRFSILGSQNYNTDTVTFITSGKTMYWATADAKKTPIQNDLTVLFLDDDGNPRTMPILRPANKFEEERKNYIYQSSVDANRQSGIGAGTETIEVVNARLEPTLVPRELRIKNEFTAITGRKYTCILYLKRVDLFSLLDQTDWQVKDMQVIGMVPGADGSYISGNPDNYVITDTDYLMPYNKPITLRTSIKNNIRVLEYTVNNKAQNFSTTKFIDRTLNNNQELIAPYLRAGSGFNVIEEYQPPFEERFQAVFEQHQFPGHEILYVTEYGPNAEIVIDNSVCYHEQINPKNVHHYWVRMKLTPYNPYSY